MAKQKELLATRREETGKNEMRRIRNKELVPGIVFGRSGDTVPVTFSKKDLENLVFSDTGFNTIFKIKIDGEKQYKEPMVIIKEYQLDPVTHKFLHVSFYRIHMDRKVEVNIPIVTSGLAPGVKNQGGTLDQVMREIHIECLPADIPESIHVDVSQMKINDMVRIADLNIPAGVEVMHEDDAMVIHLIPPRKAEDLEAEEGAAAAEGEAEDAEETEE